MQNIYNNLYDHSPDAESLKKDYECLDDICLWVERQLGMTLWPHEREMMSAPRLQVFTCSNSKCAEPIQYSYKTPPCCEKCNSTWAGQEPGPIRHAYRIARRSGKSMVISWYACHTSTTFANASVIICVPGQPQLDQLFDDKIRVVLDGLGVKPTRNTRSPHLIELPNGSTIRGFCTAKAVRGYGGKLHKESRNAKVLLLFDEMDFLEPGMWEAAYPIVSEGSNVDVIVSSTPSGLRGIFFQLCERNDMYQEFHYTRQEVCSMYRNWVEELLIKRTDLDQVAREEERKLLLANGPQWNEGIEQELRSSLTAMGYVHEVEAKWGALEGGVFDPYYVTLMFEGDESRYEYSTLPDPVSPIRTMGVDWNKATHGPEIVGLEINSNPTRIHGENTLAHKIKVKFRINLPRGDHGELTYQNAINKIIELNEIFKPHWIYCDRGAGESQIEQLHKFGQDNPRTGLEDKVVGINFREKLIYWDVVAREETACATKHWMVSNLARCIENKIIIGLNDGHTDNTVLPDGRTIRGQFVHPLRSQMLGYHIARYTHTEPVYKCDPAVMDHALDATMLALHAIMINYFEFNKAEFATRPLIISSESLRIRKPNEELDRELLNPRDPTSIIPIRTFGGARKQSGDRRIFGARQRRNLRV